MARCRWRIAGPMIRARSCCAIPRGSQLKLDWAADVWRFSISRRSAHQPMHDAETGNWIVYNGEIYNFREIRAELERAGTSFISHSDTEVVLKAYATMGRWSASRNFAGCLPSLIWDASQHRLFIARDPMGIKPLYYAQAGSYFIFASEVRTLLGTGLVAASH